MLAFKKRDLLILLLLFLINIFSILFFYNKIIFKTEGYFTYPLDDTYIHLALAKNFLKYKTIGINGEFAFNTSSPLFTIILSILFLIFGNNPLLPLIINVTLSFLIIFYIFIFLKKNFNLFYTLIFSILFYFFIPIPILIFLGMEHLLHIFLLLLYLNNLISFLFEGKKNYLLLFVLSFLFSSVRYESIFFLFPFLLIFLYKKNFKEAIFIFLGASFPIFFLGIYSISKGWLFFPTSVVLKGFLFDFENPIRLIFDIGKKFYYYLIGYEYNLPIFLFCLFSLYFFNKKIEFLKSKVQILSFVLFLNLISQLTFAKIGRFNRYEAYIISFFLFLIIYFLKEYKLKDELKIISKISLFFIIFLGAIPFIIASYKSLNMLAIGSKNIKDQQIQMAKFLQRYYKDDWVGVNDIGAVCYFREKVFDVWGIGNLDVARKRLKNNYYKNDLEEKIKEYNIKVLIVYGVILKYLGGIPKGISFVGAWKIKDNVVCENDEVLIFARDEEIQNLIKNLKEFSKELPKDVTQKGIYLE